MAQFSITRYIIVVQLWTYLSLCSWVHPDCAAGPLPPKSRWSRRWSGRDWCWARPHGRQATKNRRKYVDSKFVHDLMDNKTDQHYFLRGHVWPSLRNDLPHNVLIVLSVTSGAVIHASCQPCKVAALGRCSHVVAVLFTLLDHVQEHGAVLTKPCTSQECTWNKGKNRDKDPKRLSSTCYPSNRRKSSMAVADFDPRPAGYRQVNPEHINGLLRDLQGISTNNPQRSMWETQLQIAYQDYDISDIDVSKISEKINILLESLTPPKLMQIPGTEGQSQSQKWFQERWLRLTASKCLSAFRIGRLIRSEAPNAAVRAFKFIRTNIGKLTLFPFRHIGWNMALNVSPMLLINMRNKDQQFVTLGKSQISFSWLFTRWPCGWRWNNWN